MKIYNTEGNLIPDVEGALCELSNAGTGMVSVTIGHMLNVRISISTPKATTLDAKSPADFYSDAGKDAVAIFMHMQETICGEVAFIIDNDFLVDVIEKLTGNHYTFEEMMDDDCGFFAVQEFGNIIGSAYVKAIGKYTGIRFFLSPVMVGVDKPQNLMSSVYLRNLGSDCRQIYVESEFTLMDEKDRPIGEAGHIIMMPDEDSVEKLMDAIGI